MPITTSAKKALRQNKTRHTRNVIKKEAYKKAVVDYRKLVAAKKFDEAAKALVIVAFNAKKTEKEEKKLDVMKGDPP